MFLEEDQRVLNIVGVDEVGRGPLAGPVVACAFHYYGSHKELHQDIALFQKLGVTDSKKITPAKRQSILLALGLGETNLKEIHEVTILAGHGRFSLSMCDEREIERINILQASLKAMSGCLDDLSSHFQEKTHVWIDGNRIPESYHHHKVYQTEAIIKGDSRSFAIGIASIIAKEFRDKLMKKYAQDYPGYAFETNAGYPTQAHRDALIKFGVTKIHRKTFKGVKELL